MLANTLRQVGLADRLLADDEQLNTSQITRLRNGGKTIKQKQTTVSSPAPYSIAALAVKHGRGLADMVNIVKMSKLVTDSNLAGDTMLSQEIWDKLEERLNDKRIRIRVLATELGIDASKLTEILFEAQYISSMNWNQKLDKHIEDKIRKALNEYESNGGENDSEKSCQYLKDIIDEEIFPKIDIEPLDMSFDEEEEGKNEWVDKDDVRSYTISSLSMELGIAEGRVINILRQAYNIEDALSSVSPISSDVADEIISYYDFLLHRKQAQSFANCYLRERETIWNNPVVFKTSSDYAPGTSVEGKVSQVDYSQRLILVEFEEISRSPYPFIFIFGTKSTRTTKRGSVTFDEWDWELEMSRNMPQAGNKYKFLILRNNPGEDLILSRRQILTPPEPKDGVGRVICHNSEGRFLYVRHDNGSYGFIDYIDLPSFNVEDGEIVQLKLVKKFKKEFGKYALQFAQYRLEGHEAYYNELWQGLDLWGWTIGAYTNSWQDLVKSYQRDRLILGSISGANDGGFILETVGNSSFELFCPYSKSPTRIDSRMTENLIGSRWLLKIESDPEGDGNNTVVSAKLNSNEYERLVKNGAYYYAIICSCNENGANVLIENSLPLFIPNKFIGWGKDNNSQQLTIGSKVIVKILKNEKGTIASIRDAYIDPWLRVSRVYPIGSILENIQPTYIEKGFIRFDLGEYTGHLHSSEISWTDDTIHDCRDVILPDPLRVVVTGYHEKSRTVQLSLRKLTPDPWLDIDSPLTEDRILSATVKELTNSGALLRVGDLGFKGYLSYRDVDWCRYVDRDSFAYSVGETIIVKVIHYNKDRRQLTCSMKALVSNPWEELLGKESVEGKVIKVSDNQASVIIAGGIECICHEALAPASEGQTLKFDILKLNVAAQQIVISYRKQELVQLNTLAVGEMFKEYRNLSETDKELVEETGDEEGPEVYRNFIIKEVSSTGRVTAVYAEDDGEYENGILLPGSVVIDGYPVNVIFARKIIKQYIKPGETLEFRVIHRYAGFNYAVLAIDAASLIDLNNIATDDLTSLTSTNGVEATVLNDICTNRNLFVQYKGYFGYIPRMESSEISDEFPDTIRVKAVIAPEHPGQMIRFSVIDQEEQQQELQEQQAEKELVELLDGDLYDCYFEINSLSGFNPKLPDYYPFALQLRYNPEQQGELAELLASDPTYFSSQTFFLDCFKVKGGNGYVLSLFNNNISISAFCSEREDGDEIKINGFTPDVSDTTERGKHYGKPLRIAGENIQIVPLNSSALPPAHQDTDIVMTFIKYNREVIPELRRLSRDGLQKRGEHYLTLQELLKMDLKREESLCCKDAKIKSEIKEVAGSLGGYGIIFDAPPEAFESIMSKDDSDEGLRVMIKPDDSEPFKDRQPSGVLKYLGSDRWIVELYANRDIDISTINQQGLSIKRFPNTRHLKKQIMAIDNFVYERNGLDIFSKIARNKLNPIEIPPFSR